MLVDLDHDLHNLVAANDNSFCNILLQVGNYNDYLTNWPAFLMHLDEFMRIKDLFLFSIFFIFLAI